MGGRANPWLNSLNAEDALDRRSFSEYKPQSFSDGLLELTSVEEIVDLLLGNSKRVGQPEGEITLMFNKVINDMPFTVDKDGIDAEDFYSFFQIDGEYFKAKNPTAIKLKLSEQLPDGSIRVLCHRV